MVSRLLARSVAGLHPGSFALVMATGIVSLACHLAGLDPIGRVLFRLNEAAYVLLWLLTLVRVFRFTPRVLADFSDPERGPGFLTMVAGTSVLGREFTLLDRAESVALVLGVLTTFLWALVLYGFLAAVIIREEKPAPGRWVNGAWLLAVVATQSVPLSWMGVTRPLFGMQEEVVFLMLAFHLVGHLLYVLVITLIMLEFIGFKFKPELLTPPYWINMGAMAITTLTGTVLIGLAPDSAVLTAVRPFVEGTTILAWAVATWWVPLLVILFGWRHLVGRVGLKYDPQYWSMVFPLGMYSACTFQLAQATGVTPLQTLSHAFAYIGLAAWAAVFAGLVRTVVTGLFGRPAPLEAEVARTLRR